MKRFRTLSLLLLQTSLLVVSGQGSSKESLNVIDDNKGDSFGLTAYGEPCSDECKPRGFPYTWCHKTPSRNGTWIDRDYCSPAPGVTRYLEPCLDACLQRDQPFYWCKTRKTKRGDWDYCSPFGSAGQLCSWSTWGTWSQCSPDCGPKSTRTRRRRFETESGKVGPCSGEIEQSISQCNEVGECPVASRPQDCIWASWGAWSSCSITCGPGPGTQRRTRPVQIHPTAGGLPCSDPDSFETVRCSLEEPCPENDSDEKDGTTANSLLDQDKAFILGDVRPGGEDVSQAKYLGRLVDHEHGVSGEVYERNPRTLVIKDFKYDGSGPDAFFWVGTLGNEPNENGHIVPYPYTGRFFHYLDPDAPVLRSFFGEDIELTLPPEIMADQIRWISVWCRRFAVNFGDLILPKPSEAPRETTTEDPLQKFAEEPRSINVSIKNKDLNNDNSDKKNKENKDPPTTSEKEGLPFTVVRVSSTVSHVRPKVEFQTESGEETTYASVTTTPESPADPATTTTRRGSRPPFFKPLTKFPDIRIPSFDDSTAAPTSATATTSPSTKIRLSIFSRKPPNVFHPTTASPTTSTTISAGETTAPSTAADVPITTAATTGADVPITTAATTAADVPITTAARTGADVPITTAATTSDGSTSAAETALTSSTTSASAETTPLVIALETTAATTASESTRTGEVVVTDGTTATTSRGISTTVEATTFTSADQTTEIDQDETKSGEDESSTESSTTESSTTESSTAESSTDSDQATTVGSDDFEDDDFAPETTPAGSKTDGVSTEGPNSNGGRAGSRFKDLGSLRELFAKRKNQTVSPIQAELNRLRNPDIAAALTTPPSLEGSTRKRPTFLNRFRSTEATLRSTTAASLVDDDESETEENDVSSSTTSPLIRSRRPFINRFKPTEASSSSASPEADSENAIEESPEATPDPSADSSFEPSTTGRTRPSFLNRLRTTDTPFSTPPLPVEQDGADPSRPTLKPFFARPRSTSTTPEPTQRPLSFFRTRGTRKPFGHSRSTRAPEVSTISNDNKIEESDKKADKVKEEDKITQLYPDPDYEGEDEEEENEASPTPSPTTATTTERKFSPTTRTQTTFQTTPKLDTTTTSTTTTTATSAEETTTEPFFVTPLTEAVGGSISSSATSDEPGYKPCSLADACGPNAICESPNGVDPVCKCPPGFSGIPRDGSPDPAHGCVRTPVKCSEPESDVCPESTVCIRDYCLPSCEVDVECSLGERCVDGACIKICFYDAHCLAGEFCEKTEESGGNGVCLSGCRRDTNCPFGQVCKDRKCEDGCHFNNDCTQNTACINGTCTDPCLDFTECGANAVCNAVSHAPACSCPEGLRELNSPYEACVPEGMNLSDLECLRSSDCQSGFECKEWQCKQS